MMSLYISKDGIVDAERVKVKIFPRIERGEMRVINGIVVHQTAAPTSSHTFNSYSDKLRIPNGAHFLIDKDGTIYQTASLFKVTNHVGLLQSRCLLTHNCTPTELRHSQDLDSIKGNRARALAVHHESKKIWPNRFPSNVDSIGIECVGEALGDPGKEVFIPLTAAQNNSLGWLVKELARTFDISMQEVFRHPQVGRKNETEASTAKW